MIELHRQGGINPLYDRNAPSEALRPLLWIERAVVVPTTHVDQEQFGSLPWAEPYDENEPAIIGIKRIVIGTEEGVIFFTRNEQGALVKQEIARENYSTSHLGGGPAVESRIEYANDSRFSFGEADSNNSIVVSFQRGVGLDAERITVATEVVTLLLKTVAQDEASRKVKQAKIDLEQMFAKAGNTGVLARVVGAIDNALIEAAIDEGLVTDATTTLPQRIRELAESVNDIGIKIIKDRYFNNDLALWPASIRVTWRPETDDLAWKEWQMAERVPMIDRDS